MTDIYRERINPESPDSRVIDRAVDILNSGRVVVAPTETRYGMLARADQDAPVEQIFRLKRRPDGSPTAVFIGTTLMIMHYAVLNPSALRLAELFLPGPLTLVLRAVEGWDSPVICNGTIGVRVSSSPCIQALMERVNCPLTATSANLSGNDDNSRIDEIVSGFGDQVALYLDGGVLESSPSTVVDCTGDEAHVLREGAIPVKTIRNALKGASA